MDEPNQILKNFVHGLPVTIRELVIAQCCISFEHFEARPDFDFAAAFDELVDYRRENHETWQALQIAKILGVIDVLLVPDETYRQFAEKLAAEHDSESFSKMALQAPLRERHFERSREEYLELRAGPLSPEALRVWWHILQARHPLR